MLPAPSASAPVQSAAASLWSAVTLPRAFGAVSLLAVLGGMYWWRFASNSVNAPNSALTDFARARNGPIPSLSHFHPSNKSLSYRFML